MILSRVWYVVLGVAVAVALYVVYVAVGQYNRQTVRALKEGLASDSQTLEWALKIDARRRLDALLVGSVDLALRQALVTANASTGKVPDKPRTEAKKALAGIADSIPVDWRNDALFAVDRNGTVVAEIGYDVVVGNEDFELGGYPAVNDALHGWLRDDVWVLGNKMYAVVARPVEYVDYDPTQRPSGAIVGLKEVNGKFADDLAKRTRTNLAFFAAGKRTAAGTGVTGFDAEKLDAVGNDLKNVDSKTYGDAGRSDVRMLADDLGAMYARLPGDAWTLGAGFAVVRARTILPGPGGFLSGADDLDKANVPWLLLVVVVLLATAVGVAFTLFEHSGPLRELLMQADRLKKGVMERLELGRFRGSYRLAAQGINDGIDRAIEKSGGVTRKPADLDSILGPTPAQPAMSAFAFPPGEGAAPLAPAALAPPVQPAPPPPVPRSAPGLSRQTPPAAVPAFAAPGAPAPTPVAPRSSPQNAGLGKPPPLVGALSTEDDDATMVGSVPADVMAQATGDTRAALEESADWATVFEDFVRTKKQCGEPIDGLTFEKFSHTLKKNRDALVKRHGCKRVKFSVYVKDGKASLKATPVRE
ncbi:MAG TPA: MXAN_5187 family protein [Polyangiaceae bacterium]|jgi:hypothetical protein|nr:MXAN_5187 family protein [Polyangiaceae bacterium]